MGSIPSRVSLGSILLGGVLLTTCSGCGEHRQEASVQQGAVAPIQGASSTTDTFAASKDSYVSKAQRNRNHGADDRMIVSGSGNDERRSVVAFQLGDVAVKVSSATLVLTLRADAVPSGWPTADGSRPQGQLLARTIRTDWAEGTNTAGSGVTWSCPTDSNIANAVQDCADDWNGGLPTKSLVGVPPPPPPEPTSPPVGIENGQTGTVEFDVTQDVLAGSRSWLVSALTGGGDATFYSRDAAKSLGNAALAPRLVLRDLVQVVGAGGGTLRANGGGVILDVPAGALTQDTDISITPTPVEATVPYSGLLAGTLYDFAPHGLTFSQPATLTITYDPATVPSAIAPSSLIILSSVHNAGTQLRPLDKWEERPSRVDVSTSQVTGTIEHFSHDGVGKPVTQINVTPSCVGLIPGTEQALSLDLLAADGSRVTHVVDWSSDDPTVAAGALGPGLDQGLAIAPSQGSIGQTTVTATVRNSPPDVDAHTAIPVTVALATLTIETPTSTSANDLNDARTLAVSASADLIFRYGVDIDAHPVTTTFSALTYLGQEVTVLDFFGYGMGDNDLGGANTLGPFTSGFGWPFVTGAQFSTMHPSSCGDPKAMTYDHPTGHIMRYVRGTCAQRSPFSALFDQLSDVISSMFICVTRDALGNLSSFVDVTRKELQVQPHFRGQVGLSLLNQAPVEAGVFFIGTYDVRVPVINAGVTIHMNPGYSITRRSDGFVQAALINNAPNVSVINDFEQDGELISDKVRDKLREAAPTSIAAFINKKLLQPLGTSCDPSGSDGPDACLQAALTAADTACKDGVAPEACIAPQVLTRANFQCMETGVCGFHPLVQEVNVLPEGIELVFAPNPFTPAAQLDRFFRALSPVLGGSVCGDPPSTDTRIAQPVASLQVGESSALNDPPIACSDLGL